MEKSDTPTILFTLVYKTEETRVQTFTDQYMSLMTLISDHLAISGFGLCSGMGSCGTCLIHIRRKQVPVKTSWLSCGMAVNDDLANTYVIIPDPIF